MNSRVILFNTIFEVLVRAKSTNEADSLQRTISKTSSELVTHVKPTYFDRRWHPSGFGGSLDLYHVDLILDHSLNVRDERVKDSLDILSVEN